MTKDTEAAGLQAAKAWIDGHRWSVSCRI